MFYSIISLGFLFSLSSIAQSIIPPKMDSLLIASEQIYSEISGPSFSNKNCFEYLSLLENQIDSIDVAKISKEQIIINGNKIVENSWKIRQFLHSHLSEFDKNCVTQIQTSFRQFRFIEEYVLEILTNVTHLTPEEVEFEKQLIPLIDPAPYYSTLQNNHQSLEFNSGDLLVTRGVSFLSAMIARLGLRGTQFSHTVFVHKDQESHDIKTIESYVGSGVQFYDLEDAMRNENARILWLRAKDKGISEKADLEISNLVKERIEQNNPIKYDYQLDFKDHSTMSCAEVSQVAFKMASNGEFNIPFYPNQIGGVNTLTDRLMVEDGATYEPGDMEIDPRFELVAEWRDLRLTRDSRQKDAILTSLFKWMRENNYKLKDNFKSKMAGGFIYKIRKTFLWPLVKKMLKLDDFSREVPSHMIKLVSLINEIGEQLQAELREKDLAFETMYGVPMGYMDMYRELEGIRKRDFEIYKISPKQAKFHKIFRPEE